MAKSVVESARAYILGIEERLRGLRHNDIADELKNVAKLLNGEMVLCEASGCNNQSVSNRSGDAMRVDQKLWGMIRAENMSETAPPVEPRRVKNQLASNPDDPVNHPSHYTSGDIEVLDAIEDWKLGYHLGQVVKYVARSGKKDPSKEVEDLKKAQFYLNREISRLEEDHG